MLAIDVDAVATRLQDKGATLFVNAWHELLVSSLPTAPPCAGQVNTGRLHHACAGCRCRRNPREDPRYRTKRRKGISLRAHADCRADGRRRQEARRRLEV